MLMVTVFVGDLRDPRNDTHQQRQSLSQTDAPNLDVLDAGGLLDRCKRLVDIAAFTATRGGGKASLARAPHPPPRTSLSYVSDGLLRDDCLSRDDRLLRA